MRSSPPLACTCLAVLACGEGPAPVLETEAACPITAPVRLAAAPADFEPAPNTWYGLHVFDDDLLFTFDRFDDPRREYWHLERCTGALQPYPSLAPGLHNPYIIRSALGRVVYANDALGGKFIVDRLDVPGDDDPRPVPGLPEGTSSSFFWAAPDRPYAEFQRWAQDGSRAFVIGAAGLGGYTFAVYTHDGDAETPARAIADAAIRTWPRGQHMWIHDDDGALRRVDPLTGDGEVVLTGVRHVDFFSDQSRIVWQAIGDDVAEPVYLRDLDGGDDLPIAVNDFAALSWYRDPERSGLGSWSATRDGAAVALRGPERRLVAAVRTDTGAALDIPDHTGLVGALGGEFKLVLSDDDDPDHTEALWHPLTGAVRVWYRGPDLGPILRSVDGDLAEYFLPDAHDAAEGSLWQVDLVTGEASKILARVDEYAIKLDDGRYFLRFATRSLPGPPFDGSSYRVAYDADLKLVDPATGLYTPIADDVSASVPISGEGLVYLDAHGPEPGIWAYPVAFP